MNKIIRDYPVDRLPKEWQEGLPKHGTVEVELRPVSQTRPRIKLADLVGTGPNVHGSMSEIVDYIAGIRADRDDAR